MHPTWLRTGLAVYLSVMIPYGVANMANDGWHEQIVERGWAAWAVPDMLRPEPERGPGALRSSLAAAAIYFSCFRAKSSSG